MPLLHVLILALVQGVTEFLPISSSGHLVLTWQAFDIAGWQVAEETKAERLVLDIAVHLGTLFAVLVYFRADVGEMLSGAVKLTKGRRDPGGQLVLYIVAATLPLLLAGFLMKDLVTESLRNPTVIAWATIGFGLLLYAGDKFGLTLKRLEHIGYGSVAVIGLAQVLALIPGTSRSGITMTAARFCGLERTEAARFSLLLAVPAILGAATLAGIDLYRMGDLRLGLSAGLAAGFAFAAALAAIAAMMNWLKKASFTPFVVYRILLGALLLYLINGTELGAALGS
ncbi:MAG: undecaprenyl-diphosphate phosphatase [Rhodospirillales bacterium]|nr:undecaprenyl-diphosphate phosphatase [Rhodospirillales bacterium]